MTDLFRAALDRNFGIGGGGFLKQNTIDNTWYEYSCHSKKCIGNEKIKQYIMDIITYLFYFVNDGKDLYGEGTHYEAIKAAKTATMKKIANMTDKKLRRDIFCSKISNIKRKKEKSHAKTKQHLFNINYTANRTIFEVIACCYEEELLTECLTMGITNDCQEVYLPRGTKDLEDLNTITVQSIGRLICLFDFNHKKGKEKGKIYQGEERTAVASLTDALKGYVKLEFWRSQPMIALLIKDMISGVGLVFGWAGNFYGPMLFIWRYILKYTNTYFDAYYELNGQQGRMNLDNSLVGATPALNLMFRAFLKDTIMDANERGCDKQSSRIWAYSYQIMTIVGDFFTLQSNAMLDRMKELRSGEDLKADKKSAQNNEICNINKGYRTALFKKHVLKFTDYRSSIFDYNIMHFVALKNIPHYPKIVKKEMGYRNYNQLLFKKSKKIDEGAVPSTFCEFNTYIKMRKKEKKEYNKKIGIAVQTEGRNSGFSPNKIWKIHNELEEKMGKGFATAYLNDVSVTLERQDSAGLKLKF